MQRVLILYGGRSAEHEISIISGSFIAASLDRTRFEPIFVGVAPDGTWHLQTETATSKDPREVSIDTSGPKAWLLPMPSGVLHVEGRDPIPFDIAFPVFHGPMGEDGAFQGLLELAAVPYVGAGVSGSAVAMDKTIMKKVFEHAELPIVKWAALTQAQYAAGRDDQLARIEELPYPLFVKPANLGSSQGISKATDRASLVTAIEHALSFDTKLVIEQGLVDAREIECAVLGNHDPRVSLPGEIVVTHADGFYSYDAKYIDDGATLKVPADLYHAEQNAVQLLALRAFRAVDCAGMARVDMFLTAERDIYLNEVNTIPGFTAISMYPRLWAASGVPAQELVSELLDLAVARHKERSTLRTTRL